MSAARSRFRFLYPLTLALLFWTGCAAGSDLDAVVEVVGAVEKPPTPAPTVPSSPTATPVPTVTPVPTATSTPPPTPTPFAIADRIVKRLPEDWTPVLNTELQSESSDELPAGGVLLPADYSGSRWSYIGVLGRLRPREQVVPRGAPAVPAVDGVAPLTGLTVDLPVRPALIVKIDNVPAARPQTGISQADIVYEELVESGITRFAAVFHSTMPDVIGPVRSGRSTDIGIIASFNKPVFAFSGANSIYEKLIDKQRIVNRGAEVFGGYWRSGSRSAPHNLYTSAATMLNSTEDGEPPRPHFAYRAEQTTLPVPAQEAASVQLKYLTGNSPAIEYIWDDETGTWPRWMSGRRHVDSSGVQLAPENLVVQFVNYIDTGLTDKWGEDLYEGVSVGSGGALVFTDGHVIEAIWTRHWLRAPATFTDLNGNHIELTPGQTHVALIAPGGATWN